VNVTVVWATPLVQDIVEIELPAGATIADAVAQSGLVLQYGADLATLGFAIFGRRAAASALLADGDRVELTRPLEADPRVVRAARASANPRAKAIRHAKRPRPR
jgi:putative ubiquitin-RnfH superfamily antitoxin RatB of RatAB toxin-antitoxin module